jgi:FkbM family methyltransferase
MIEPQDGLKADVADLLQRPNIEWITAGAGAENRTMPLTIAPFDHSSTFVISAEKALSLGMKQLEVPVCTLNQIVRNKGGRIPELVKIDAEGFDLKVIKGASDLIGKTEIFLLEAAVAAPGIENTITMTIKNMDELGYQVFDITDLNYSPSQDVLWLMEIAFVKKDGTIISKITPNY